jgi:hypothetical protein
MNELQTAVNSIKDMDRTPILEFNPHNEVSTTIISLLGKITSRFDAEDEYNQQLKDSLIARLPEATWGEIAQHLSSREVNENERLRGLLSPFIPKDGDRVPLLDSERREIRSDEKLFNGSTKDSLQAVDMLTKVLIEFKKRKDAQVSNATSIAD